MGKTRTKDRHDSPVKNAFILIAITVVAGLLLGLVHEVTMEPIARASEHLIQDTCMEVQPAAETVTEDASIDMQVTDPDTGGSIVDASRYEINGAYISYAGGSTPVGYVIDITTHEGYGGDIELMVGIAIDGTVTGVSVLSSSETPGLGMKAGEVLAPQFAGHRVTQFEWVKTGKTVENQVDAITGATVTTKAVTGAVNTALNYARAVYHAGGSEDE